MDELIEFRRHSVFLVRYAQLQVAEEELFMRQCQKVARDLQYAAQKRGDRNTADRIEDKMDSLKRATTLCDTQCASRSAELNIILKEVRAEFEKYLAV